MNVNYKVIWVNPAKYDLAGIIEYISNDNPSHAREIFQELHQKTASLCHFPQRCRIIPELQKQGIYQYRELIIPPWRIMYRISEENVYIVAVLDCRQNIEDILFQRLIRP
ncbi:MAG: type II toxin-antitoxin system RelE/ParE family toxin [bacterium]